MLQRRLIFWRGLVETASLLRPVNLVALAIGPAPPTLAMRQVASRSDLLSCSSACTFLGLSMARRASDNQASISATSQAMVNNGRLCSLVLLASAAPDRVAFGQARHHEGCDRAGNQASQLDDQVGRRSYEDVGGKPGLGQPRPTESRR
jgi:hypothetical protein